MDRTDYNDQIQGQIRTEDLAGLARGAYAATEGLPGELQQLLNAIAGANVFGTGLENTEQRARARGIDLDKPGESVGQYFDFTGPLGKLVGAMSVAPAIVKGAKLGKYADEYPPILHPKLEVDKKNPAKMWPAKNNPPETNAFMRERSKVAKDVSAGNYEPYFDPGQRFDATGEYEPRPLTTQYAKPKKEETVQKWRDKVKTPEAKARVIEAYNAGVESGGHDAWYKMGQLEEEFIKEYGPEKGPEMFRERFSDAMAATTGGADPTGNLLAATFANYKRAKDQELPTQSYDINSPVGGRFISGNMSMYDKVINQGEGLAGKPKRSNFSSNFEGDDRVVTIDEHMTQLITPGKNAPEGDSYFAYEELMQEIADELGIPPRQLQEVAWGGRKANLKGGYDGKPMIEIVNEAIERTSRLTGVEPGEVVRKGLVRGEMPIYQAAGATALAPLIAAMAGGEQSGEQ